MAAQMSCSMFCSCNAGSNCCNEQTRTVAANPAADEADDVWKTKMIRQASIKNEYACLHNRITYLTICRYIYIYQNRSPIQHHTMRYFLSVAKPWPKTPLFVSIWRPS